MLLNSFSEIMSFPPHRLLMLVSVLWAEVACRDLDRQATLPQVPFFPWELLGMQPVSSHACGQLTPLDLLTTPPFKRTALEAAPRASITFPLPVCISHLDQS